MRKETMEAIPLVPVDAMTITTLVDNTTDLLLGDEGPARRPPSALSRYPGVPARFLEGGQTADLLRGEHGCARSRPRRPHAFIQNSVGTRLEFSA